MAATISQHVNALLASYVAIEAEQMQLLGLKTEEADRQCDLLAESASAILVQIDAIRDRSANPDLLAARFLFSLMLGHPWKPEAGIDWSPEALSEALPLLEALSGGLTGAVRHETRRALATIGVEIPEADPFIARMEAYRAEVAAFNAAPGDSDNDPADLFGEELSSGAVRIGSAPGAALALRHVLANESIGDTFDTQLVEAVCAFLEARA